MNLRPTVIAIACLLTLATSGCVSAMVSAMRNAEAAYKDAEAKSNSGEFASADARIGEIVTLFKDPAVSQHSSEKAFAELHRAALAELGTLSSALKAEVAADVKAGFSATFKACEACHQRY